MNRNLPIVVQGSDLDYAEAENLTIGDKLLVEIDGQRAYGDRANPLLSSSPWTVIDNRLASGKPLILSHPDSPHPLVLPFLSIINASGPLVFSVDRHVVILQYISQYYSSISQAKELFKNTFNASFLKDNRQSILKHLSVAVSGLKDSWHYTGIHRFALRSGVNESTLNLLAKGFTISDSDLVKVCTEFGWFDSIKSASKLSVAVQEHVCV